MGWRAASLAALGAMMVLSLGTGSVWLSPRALLDGLWTHEPTLASVILWELRMPRTLLAVLVGASLGLAGAALQGLLRNPLAEPGLLGVTSGGALGAVIAIYFGFSASFALATPVLGIAGALIAAALTFSVSRGNTLTLILAGIGVSGLMGAGLSIALNFAPNSFAVYEITQWLLGTLADREWAHVWLALPFILVGSLCLMGTARALDALTLGEAQAQSLGIKLSRARLLTLFGTALSVGAATAVTGSVGFIGLLAPHIVRPFVGHQPSRILLPSAVLGAILILGADMATRLIPTPVELKLGVITSLMGAPFFIWLIYKMRRTLV